MTDDEILAERAQLYARVEEPALRAGSRCLTVGLGDRRWFFEEIEIGLLLPQAQITALPGGVRWRGWPCCGLVSHAMTTLPLLCWCTLAAHRELAPGGESAILVLRNSHVALRVPGPVDMAVAVLDESEVDDHRWSKGQLPSGGSIANLDLLRGEEA
jgi:hypothetical protein